MPILSDVNLPFPAHLMLLPQHLHAQAEDLITLMTELPHNPPSCCPYCESTQQVLYQSASSSSAFRLPSYRCRQCRATYNSLSGTPLAALRHIRLWPEFARLFLSGYSRYEIAEQTGVTPAGLTRWTKRCMLLMAQYCPELHVWWAAQYQCKSHAMPPHVQSEFDRLLAWIAAIPTATKPCPTCAAPGILKRATLPRTQRLPTLICAACGKAYNMLTGTPLWQIKKIELWPAFLTLMVQGAPEEECAQAIGVALSSVVSWRKRFTEVLEQDYPNLLVWYRWKNHRHWVLAAKEDRHGARTSKPSNAPVTREKQRDERGRYRACPDDAQVPSH